MDIQRLSVDVIKKLRSSACLDSFTQCVTELVLNSIDSKTTAISIRVNLISMRIQVVDNGEGITKENMKVVGQRYFTNKCKNLAQLEKYSKYYGFRGEALANIAECAQSINIISKYKFSNETFGKILSKHVSDEIKLVKNRPSIGTTVTVEGLFYNFPVRKKRIVVELELEAIKKYVESLILIHPNISFTVRNDITTELILKSNKSCDIISSFRHLHSNIEGDYNLLKIRKEKIRVEALIFKKLSTDKGLQYIYLNKHPIVSSKIQKLMQNLILKNYNKVATNILNVQIKHPVFLLIIKCPYSRVDILMNSNKNLVEFKDWEIIKKCIEKLISFHFGKEKTTTSNEMKLVTKNISDVSARGVSQVKGAYKRYGYKRKNDRKNQIDLDIPKIENPSRHFNLVISQDFNGNGIQNDIELVKSGMNIYKKTNNESEHYTIINDCSPIHKIDKSNKKQLPIQIFKPIEKVNQKPVILKNGGNLSESSKFTNDENKGKHVIMDMFLKSTQVYKSEENLTDTLSEGTVYQEESNIILQNNFHTNINGKTKTTSVSVNVRNTKKIRKSKMKIQKKNKGIQTTFGTHIPTQYNKMKSNINNYKDHKNNENWNDKDCDPENYTVQFMNSVYNDNPILKFVSKDQKQCQINNLGNMFNMLPEKTCGCNCHSKKSNLFNFPIDNNSISPTKKPQFFPHDGDLYSTKKSIKSSLVQNYNNTNKFNLGPHRYEIHQSVCTTSFLKGVGKLLPSKRKKHQNNTECDLKSPYFLSNPNNPKYQNVYVNNNVCEKETLLPQVQNIFTFDNDNWIRSYTNFEPIGFSTQKPNNFFGGMDYEKTNQNSYLFDKATPSSSIYQADDARKMMSKQDFYISKNESNISGNYQSKHNFNQFNNETSSKTKQLSTTAFQSELYTNFLNPENSTTWKQEPNPRKYDLVNNVCNNIKDIPDESFILDTDKFASCSKQLTLWDANKKSSQFNQRSDTDFVHKQGQEDTKTLTIKRNKTEQLFSGNTQENELIFEPFTYSLKQNEDVNGSKHLDDQKVIESNENDWIKKYNNFGNSFYLNKKTGRNNW